MCRLKLQLFTPTLVYASNMLHILQCDKTTKKKIHCGKALREFRELTKAPTALKSILT